MTYIVKIEPSNDILFVKKEETILEAALRQRFLLPFCCQNAVCGACTGQVLEGEIYYPNTEPMALLDDEIDAGYALFCSAAAKSNLIVHIEDVTAPYFKREKHLTYQLGELEQLTTEIWRVILHPPENDKFNYIAGQYIELLNKDGIARPYTIANAPTGANHIELHLRVNNKTQFNTELLSELKNNQLINIKGPYGKCYFHTGPELPIIIVAGGTGFTHSKAIIEAAIENNCPHPIHLYWGVTHVEDLYWHEQIASWEDKLQSFRYTPVVLKPEDSKDKWNGRTGYVHQVVLEDYDDLAAHQVYASGPEEMVISALQQFQLQGMRRELMFSDAFEFID